MFFLASVSAFTLGEYEQGEPVVLRQVCDCSYVNVSSVYAPNGSLMLGQTAMSQDGKEFTLTFNDTGLIGSYVVSGYGDPNSITDVWTYDFEVVRKDAFGLDMDSNVGIIMFIVFMIISVGLFLFGYYTFSSALFMLNGLVMLFNGFNFLYSVIIFIIGFLILFGVKK